MPGEDGFWGRCHITSRRYSRNSPLISTAKSIGTRKIFLECHYRGHFFLLFPRFLRMIVSEGREFLSKGNLEA